jgi:5-methylcytosine-specific restriction endonuclease McrA
VCEVRRTELVAAIGKPCAYCGEPMAAPTRDHIRPRSKGGTLAQGKALVCSPCNGDKGSRSLASWLYRLRKAGDQRAEIVAEFMVTCGGCTRPLAVAISPEA